MSWAGQTSTRGTEVRRLGENRGGSQGKAEGGLLGVTGHSIGVGVLKGREALPRGWGLDKLVG